MRISASIDDPRYVQPRNLDVTFWPVVDLERLQSTWVGEVEITFHQGLDTPLST